MAEETVNRELNELVDREALSTHARSLVYLFILIYILFVFLSTVFPWCVCWKMGEENGNNTMYEGRV